MERRADLALRAAPDETNRRRADQVTAHPDTQATQNAQFVGAFRRWKAKA